LFDRQEGTDLIAAWADYTDCAGYHQRDKVVGQRECKSSRRHQGGARNQGALTPEPVCLRRKKEGHRRVTNESESQQQARLSIREADSGQVQHQNHREHPVREQAN
jgi:hypothetical protein